MKAIRICALHALLWELLCIQALGCPPSDVQSYLCFLSHLCSPMLALMELAREGEGAG